MVFRRKTWIAAAALWGALACMALGAVRVDVLSPAKEAAPGGVVTHVFAVAHDGASDETYFVTVVAPASWGILGVPEEITVAPGEEATVFVTLTVPVDASAGSYVLTLQVESVTNPAVAASAGITTRIAAVSGVELVPPEATSVLPGVSVSYSILAINRGNTQDVVAITATSSRGYSLEVAVPTLELSPRESRAVTVSLAVPADAASGRDVLTVRASSTLYAGVEDEVALFTTILPPGPDVVGGSLYELLPARLLLDFGRDETTGTADSQLTLSTSGAVLGGTFSASATALHPFGPTPLDITAYSLAYRVDSASFAIGSVSQVLTNLQSVACHGGMTSIDTRLVAIALIAGGEGDETRFGGSFTFGPEEARVGVGYSDVRSESAQASAWTGLAKAEPVAGWTLRAEGGLGTLDGKVGRAAFFGTIIDVPSYFLSADVLSVDTYFPGPRSDTAGIEASQRLRLSALSLGLSLSHLWGNVVGDPLVPTLVSDSLGVNLSTTPWEEGPTLQATINLAREHSVSGTPYDDVEVLLGYNVAEAEGPFPYAFSGRINDAMDLVLDVHERTLTHTQEVGLSVDEFAVRLLLSEEKVVDVAHTLVLSSAASASLFVQPVGAQHEASIEFISVEDELRLEASFLLHVIEDLNVELGGYADWAKDSPASASFGWSLKLSAAFDIPFPFLITKGRIDGHVFVDQNGNGSLDAGEAPAAGAVVYMEEGEVSTDPDGIFRFPPLAPRRYSLSVRDLPRNAALGSPVIVDLKAGEQRTVDIALLPILVVRGAVFEDGNEDAARQPDEPGIAGIRVNLRGGAGTTATTTDVRGEFVFSSVSPGTYTVTLDARTLPERFALTTAESQSVDPSQASLVLFGGFIRPRQVVVTFQPPTADARHAPDAPKVGEDVTFDGSASFDFDGEIEEYSWDFNSDGTPDSDQPVATHAFEEAGHYRVTLTVTDDAGNSDTKTLELDVGAAPATSTELVAPEPAAVAEPTPPTAGTPTEPSATAEPAGTAAPSQVVTPTTPPSASPVRPPVADFAYHPVAPTAGQSIEFDAAASVDFDGAIEIYAWDFDGDGAVDAEGETIEWTFRSSGSYPVTLTVIDAARLSDAVTYEVEVLAPSVAPVSVSPAEISARFAYTPLVPRPGQAVQFDAAASVARGGQRLSYAWDFDADGATDSTDKTAEWAFSAPGSYSVTLTVASPDGQSEAHVITIPVIEPSSGPTSSQPPIAAVQYIPVNPRAGDLVMFNATASVDLDGRILAYAWDFDADDVFDSTEPIVKHAYVQPGSFPVRLTVFDDAGNSDSLGVTIVVQ